MSKKQQKPDTSPLTITFTIDPALKLNAQGERVMATTIIAKRGDVAQISALDVTNWKHDLPAEMDRLVRLLLGGGLVMPAFPNMGDANKISSNDQPAADDSAGDGEEAETTETGEEGEAVEGLPAGEETEADKIPEQAVDEDADPDFDKWAEDHELHEETEDENTAAIEEFENELPPAA